MTSLRTRQRLVQRLRAAGIHNKRVLDVILTVPRHFFIEDALTSRAYEDIALPIGFGQTISQPYVVARMTQALLENTRPGRVLEIGTGSGYQTAVLAALVDQIYSLERIGKLLDRARERLRLLRLRNIRLKHGDGNLGWPEYGPYDGIVVTAAAQTIPATLLTQLKVGGCLLMPVGEPQVQKLIRVKRKINGYQDQELEPVSFVPLLGGVL